MSRLRGTVFPLVVLLAGPAAAEPYSACLAPATPPDPPATTLGEGVASYYHPALAGRKTANGERYADEAMTAAHRELPFGSQVRVTRVATGKSVVVRINDRGPFRAKRVIDLSREAARRLGILHAGLAKVRLELLDGARGGP